MSNAIFIREALVQEAGLFLGLFTDAFFDFSSQETTWFFEQSNDVVSCRIVREREIGMLDEEDSWRHGKAGVAVHLQSQRPLQNRNYFIYSSPGCKASRINANLDLAYTSIFDTANAQAELWLRAYSEACYHGFMGTLDKELVQRQQARLFGPGDVVPIELEEHPQCRGVLEFLQGKGHAWDVRIHLAHDPQSSSETYSVGTYAGVQIDDFIIEFKRRLGIIRPNYSVSDDVVIQ